MGIKVDGIESEDELKKAQAAAQKQGTTITNYSEWSQILKEFQENGIESTGSFAGDKSKMEEVKQAVAEYVKELQAQEKVQESQPKNNETEKVQEVSQTDKEQNIKASVANATSSQIMSDYMKYYHMLM